MQNSLRSLCSFVGLAFLTATFIGCSNAKPKLPPGGETPAVSLSDPWILGSPASNDSTPALLWNGLLGVRISRSGNGFGADGKPLGFYMIDEYQSSGEEKIVEMPNPILVNWSVGNQIYSGDKSKEHDFIKSGGTPLSPTGEISDYKQTLDMRTSVLSTSWTQKTPEAGAVSFQCDTVVHPLERIIAQKWQIKLEKPTTFSVKSLDYAGPTDNQESVGGDPDQTIFLSASKSRAVTTVASLSGADAGARVSVDGFRIQEGTAISGKPIVFERVISFGAHNATPLPEFGDKNVALLKKVAPQPRSFEQVENATVQEWKARWATDIQIDGPVRDQQAVRSFLFYLQSSIAPGHDYSVSPFALSDDKYNGHVFWDSDIWVLPAIDLLYPAEAKSIAEYRIQKAAQAEHNFSAWYATKKGAAGSVQALGIKYPWESSVSGKETAPGESKLEEHITGSVVWGLTQAEALGLAPRDQVDRIASLAANEYSALSSRKSGETQSSIDGVMSPDENHVGNNDLYTNLLASWLNLGRRWQNDQVTPFVLPHDSKGLISYDGDKFKGYKQAAAVLSIYPLQYPAAERDAVNMLNRFEPAVIKNGPAMTDSVHALIWARAGNTKKAYEDWHKSWEPFTANAFYLFSEKAKKNETYFTTGAGGSLQSVIYGFLGFRVDSNPQPGSIWQCSLMGNRTLSLKPNLPAEWRSVTVKGLRVPNARYSFHITKDGVQANKEPNTGSLP